jgi:hypothetical protein
MTTHYAIGSPEAVSEAKWVTAMFLIYLLWLLVADWLMSEHPRRASFIVSRAFPAVLCLGLAAALWAGAEALREGTIALVSENLPSSDTRARGMVNSVARQVVVIDAALLGVVFLFRFLKPFERPFETVLRAKPTRACVDATIDCFDILAVSATLVVILFGWWTATSTPWHPSFFRYAVGGAIVVVAIFFIFMCIATAHRYARHEVGRTLLLNGDTLELIQKICTISPVGVTNGVSRSGICQLLVGSEPVRVRGLDPKSAKWKVRGSAASLRIAIRPRSPIRRLSRAGARYAGTFKWSIRIDVDPEGVRVHVREKAVIVGLRDRLRHRCIAGSGRQIERYLREIAVVLDRPAVLV